MVDEEFEDSNMQSFKNQNLANVGDLKSLDSKSSAQGIDVNSQYNIGHGNSVGKPTLGGVPTVNHLQLPANNQSEEQYFDDYDGNGDQFNIEHSNNSVNTGTSHITGEQRSKKKRSFSKD